MVSSGLKVNILSVSKLFLNVIACILSKVYDFSCVMELDVNVINELYIYSKIEDI